MNKLTYAKNKLQSGSHSLVICADCDTIISDSKGIRPLLDALEAVKHHTEIFAADRIVGKAAAMLYVLMKAKGVWAEVISRDATDLLSEYGIKFDYDILTDNIINRSGTGPCPMEQAVKNINDPQKAYEAIVQKLNELSERRQENERKTN